MTAEANKNLIRSLEMERIKHLEKGKEFGYTECNMGYALIAGAVADAVNKARLGKINVNIAILPPTSDMLVNGIKVSGVINAVTEKKDKKEKHLSDFWNMVDYAEVQLNSWNCLMNKENLMKAAAKAIADEKNGELGKWVESRVKQYDARYDSVKGGF